MKNNKRILLYVGLVLFVMIFISVIFIILENNKKTIPMTDIDSSLAENSRTEPIEVNVYYLDSLNNTLVSEKREVLEIDKDSDIDWRLQEVEQIFNFMKEPSKTSGNIVSVVPDNLKLISLDLDVDKTLKADFSKEYNNMKESQEIFLRSAFVWSVTELEYINNVEISVEGNPIIKGDGQPMGKLNRENIVLNPKISPEKIELEKVILYFSDDQELELVPEERLVEVKQSQSLETQIVEQLILGPKEKGHFPTVPSETKIRNIKTEGGICYVDLSSDFVTKHTGGASGEIFTIYSIVNSLTELDQVNKVQFLIDGEKVNDYKGNLDISKPLDRKEFNNGVLGDIEINE